MPIEGPRLEELKWSIDAFKDRADKYDLFRDYYSGVQAIMIDSDRRKNIFGKLFGKLHMNLCSPVVDSLVDRLQVASFSAEGGDEMQDAADLWKRNRMSRRAGQLHLEACGAGDAYVIVWPNRNGEATFYPQKGHEAVVEYDSDEQGKIIRAAKYFEKDGKRRLTLYYPDRIEKYAAEKQSRGKDTDKDKAGLTTGSWWPNPKDFEPIKDENEAWPLVNDYGVIPVFHFANNADLGEYGQSELIDAIDIQNMLNWFVFQTLIGVEYAALPQRYATGIELEVDPITGATKDDQLLSGYEKIWQLPEGTEAGTLPPGDISALASLVDNCATWMALATQTPVHYFQMTTNMVSGESQKTAEQKLDAKVNDRTIAFGDTWAKAMALALRIEKGGSVDGLELDCNWKDTKPRNEVEFWTNAQVKTMLGVSNRQVLREAGYTDEQIDQFEEEKQAEMPAEDAALQTAEGGIPQGDEFAQSLQIAASKRNGSSANGQEATQ
jgi:hypothetical protein